MSKHFPPQTERVKAPDERLLAALPTGRETVPIGRARKHLAAGLEPRGGTDCPVCGQHAELYRRRIGSTMARQLITAYQAAGTDPFHAPTVLGTSQTGDFAKLALWGLIAERDGRRDDGGHHGRWRITKDGVAFLEGRSRVPQWVLVYDGRKIGMDGDPIGLASILAEDGVPFDLAEIRPANLPPEPEPDPARTAVVDAAALGGYPITQETEDAYQTANASDAEFEEAPLEDLTVTTNAIPDEPGETTHIAGGQQVGP
jgi:hypothetical protein